MRNRYQSYLLSCVLALSVLSGCGAKGNAVPEESETVESNETLENNDIVENNETIESSEITFEAQDIEGNAVSSDIFSNTKLTMVNVWATYCNPCLSEMPGLGELVGEYDAGEFQIVGIISDVQEGADLESLGLAEYLIDQTGADYPHLLLNESLYYALLTDVSAVPTTFFIDGEGNILDTVVGARDKSAWKEKINALLEDQ